MLILSTLSAGVGIHLKNIESKEREFDKDQIIKQNEELDKNNNLLNAISVQTQKNEEIFTVIEKILKNKTVNESEKIGLIENELKNLSEISDIAFSQQLLKATTKDHDIKVLNYIDNHRPESDIYKSLNKFGYLPKHKKYFLGFSPQLCEKSSTANKDTFSLDYVKNMKYDPDSRIKTSKISIEWSDSIPKDIQSALEDHIEAITSNLLKTYDVKFGNRYLFFCKENEKLLINGLPSLSSGYEVFAFPNNKNNQEYINRFKIISTIIVGKERLFFLDLTCIHDETSRFLHERKMAEGSVQQSIALYNLARLSFFESKP